MRLLNPTLNRTEDAFGDETFELDDCESPLFRNIVSLHHVKATTYPILEYYHKSWQKRCLRKGERV